MVNVSKEPEIKKPELSHQQYGAEDLKLFKSIIEKRIQDNKEILVILENSLRNKNSGDENGKSFSSIDQNEHQSASSVYGDITKVSTYIRDLELALGRIRNKSFGVCRDTGALISKQRLLLVPHATLSIQAKNARDEKKKN